MSETWRTLTGENCETTEVLRVAGGWLYRTIVFDETLDPVATALVFQPESAK